MQDTLRFTLDLTNTESADNGNTTYYGGTYVLNGVEKQGYGDDRSDSYHADIDEAITTACHANWPDLAEFVEGTDEAWDFQEAVQYARDEVDCLDEPGTILVTCQAGKLVVTLEKV